jgi:hypothetical protein
MKTLTTTVLAPWDIQFENGFDFLYDKRGKANGIKSEFTVITPTKLRLGIHKKIELFVDTDAFVTQTNTAEKAGGGEEKQENYGFGDVYAGLKLRFTKGGGLAGLEPSSCLHVSISLPIGTSNFSKDYFAPKAILALSWALPFEIKANANIGSSLLRTTGDDEKRYMQGHFGVSIFRNWAPLTEKLMTFAEVFGDLAFTDPAVNAISFNAGFALQTDDFFKIDLGAKAGITKNAPDVVGYIGVAIRL